MHTTVRRPATGVDLPSPGDVACTLPAPGGPPVLICRRGPHRMQTTPTPDESGGPINEWRQVEWGPRNWRKLLSERGMSNALIDGQT